jgi:rhamnogalacturonan endolyase
VKRFPVDASYNTILLDCYDNEGVFKWRIDLGPNVETYISSMTAPVLVADFNSDGKSEIILKTGESTIFGDGYKIPDTDGDGITDYNSHAGSGTYANIMAGPEFLSYVDGETGKELDRNSFLTRRDPYSDWGDTYGARMNFMMSAVGYFDGVHPACVFSRGDGGDMDIDTWDIVNGKLHRIWYYTARGKTFSPGWWTDFHQVQCIDVDGDGKDEISWGGWMMTELYYIQLNMCMVIGFKLQILTQLVQA